MGANLDPWSFDATNQRAVLTPNGNPPYSFEASFGPIH